MSMEEFFRGLLAGLILLSLSIPILGMLRFTTGQWEVLGQTWFFIPYAIIVYIIGSLSLHLIWINKK